MPRVAEPQLTRGSAAPGPQRRPLREEADMNESPPRGAGLRGRHWTWRGGGAGERMTAGPRRTLFHRRGLRDRHRGREGSKGSVGLSSGGQRRDLRRPDVTKLSPVRGREYPETDTTVREVGGSRGSPISPRGPAQRHDSGTPRTVPSLEDFYRIEKCTGPGKLEGQRPSDRRRIYLEPNVG